jgi:Na+/melibiose symporter-like transporter
MRGFFRATDLYPNGQLNPAAYGAFAATFAVVLVIGIWVSAAGTHDQIPRLSQAVATTKRFSLLQVIREAGEAFAIPAFRTMVITAILFGITMGMVTALSLYLGNLYFGFTPEQLSISFPMTVLGSFIGAAVATPLGRVVREKKWLLCAGLVWFAVWNTTPISLSLLGLFPPHGDPLAFTIVLVCNSVCGLGIGLLGVMMGSMVADVTDQHEAVHGVRHEGIYYAALAFAAKFVAGAGTLLSGVIVDAAGITRSATAATTHPEALRILAYCTGPGVLVLVAITVLAASTYNISRAEHARILARING